MIILDTQTKTLEIFLGGAVSTNQLPVVATYVDVTTTAFAPGSSDADTNSTTDVTIVAAPGASTQRQIKFISVKNEDTAAATVTIQLNNNGTDRVIVEITLAVNSTLLYTDGEGFRVIDSGGSIKTVTSYGLHASSHTDGTDDIQDTSTSQKGIVQLDGTAGGTDAEVTKPPTSNVVYDHGVATSGVHGAGGNTILYSDHTADVDAHGEVVITTEDSNTATSNDLALTIAAGEGINTTSTGSTVTITGEDASTTNKGISELAIASEINGGDDTGRTISPKELSDSNYGKRIMYIKVLAFDTAVETGDEKAYITIPIELNGMNLVLAHAAVYTKSSSGLPNITLERSTDHSAWNDMLSTAITIDVNEWSSYEATTAPVINGSYDDVSTGDWIRVNVDTAGTGTAGLDIILTFQLP